MSDPSRDDPVKVALEAYVARCLELLRQRCPAEGDTPLGLGFARWLEDPTLLPGVFRLTPDIWEPHRVCAARELAGFPGEKLREYEELVEAMEADPIIGARLGPDVVAGAGLGGGGLQAETVASELMLDLIKQSEGFDPTAEAVTDTIARWLAYLRRRTDTVTILAPLSECDLVGGPIRLAPRVTIEQLTSKEIGAALMFGSWPVSDFEPRQFSVITRAAPTVMVQPPAAIRLSYSAPVVRGGGTPEEVEATRRAQHDAQGVVEEVLLALRLLKSGRVGLRRVATLRPTRRRVADERFTIGTCEPLTGRSLRAGPQRRSRAQRALSRAPSCSSVQSADRGGHPSLRVRRRQATRTGRNR
jgi:hypothetical protein